MVAESEWSWSKWKLGHSFDKLLAANAPLRTCSCLTDRRVSRVRGTVPLAERSRELVGRLCDRIGAMMIAAPYEVRYVLASWEGYARPAFRIFTVSGQGEILREIAP